MHSWAGSSIQLTPPAHGPHIIGKTSDSRPQVPAQPEVSLSRLLESTGPRQTVVGLSVICDFYGMPMDSALVAFYIGLMKLAHSTRCLSETLYQPTYKLPSAGPLPCNQPHPVLSLGWEFDSKQPSDFTATHCQCIPQETFSGRPQTLPKAIVFHEQILGVSNAWLCCNLRLLQEAADSALEQNLVKSAHFTLVTLWVLNPLNSHTNQRLF